jgi:hypothetical protein
MKKAYKLIKLTADTVRYLKRLMTEMGLSSFDDLVNTMIRVTAGYRFVFKGGSWHKYSKGDGIGR